MPHQPVLRSTPGSDTEHQLAGRPGAVPAARAGLALGGLDEHVFPAGPQRGVSALADPEARDPAGPLGQLAWRPVAGQRKIPFLPADTPANQGESSSDGAGDEDHCDDDDCGHDRSPYFWPAVMWSASSVPSPLPVLVARARWAFGLIW